jgi:hypothetical protein
MADISKLEQALIKADAAGATEDARTIANEIRKIRQSGADATTPTPLKIGAEGFPDAMREVASKGFGRAEQFLGGMGSAADLMAMRLKQAVVGLSPQDEANVQQQRALAGATGLTLGGNIAGNVAMTASPAVALQRGATAAAANVLPRVLAPAAGAAATGATVAAATNPVLKDESEVKNAAWGAAGNVLGTYAAAGLSRLAQPIQEVSKSTIEMVKRGFNVTPGQASGASSLIGQIEQKLQSIGIFGWMIDKARASGVKDMNVGAARSVAPKGTEHEITKAGRGAVEKASDLLDVAYDKAYAGIKGKVNVDSQFYKNITALPQKEGIDLPPSLAERFNKLMQDRVVSRLKDAGPDALRDIQNSIAALSRKYRASGDPDQRALGAAFGAARTEFRDLVSRQASPEFRASLEALDGKYRDFLALEKAVGYSSTKEGVFSADALNRAAKHGTKGLKDFAAAAKDVYGSTVPDSGTAGRLLLPLGLGALGSGNAGLGGPEYLTALGLGGALMATPAAGRYFYGGYPGQQLTSSALRDIAPYAGQAGRAYFSK